MHEEIQKTILAALREAGKPLAADALQIKDKEPLEQAVRALIQEKKVLLTKRRKLALPEHMGLVSGRVQGHARGFGFFLPAEGGQDAFIPADAMHGAMHGDTVWARYTDQVSRNGSPEVEVAVIVTRAYTEIVGTFVTGKRAGSYVVPDDARIPMDVLIPRDKTKKAAQDDKVVAKIVEYPDGRRPLFGVIDEVLGGKDDVGADVRSVIRQYQLPEVFTKTALRQARQAPQAVPADELVMRESLVNKCIFTIDGADAKDLDDAISLERLKNGNLYLGVHIADVSHYVPDSSALDRAALERGTSVYFVDRVLPMLPPELSNGICSLNPGVDRLTLSCFMEIDAQGRVVRHRFAETVIRSRHRLVYDDVTSLLAGDEALNKKYADIVPVLKELEALCALLNARRVKRGSIDFEIPEAHITVDGKGRPTDISRAVRGTANRIIEECMLIANETVAAHMFEMKSPFLYRVHEKPDKEKLTELNTFLQTLGYSLRNLRDIQPRAVQRVLDAAKGTKEENIVSKVVLRAMQKARYSEKCLGHFGLAADRYCHFTSPIRRYPDLVGHRIIKMMLHGELAQKQAAKLDEKLPGIAEQCSRRERAAMEAERAVDDLKKCEYMKSRVGESFAGVVSGVVSFGFFVELSNTVDGLVRVNSLEDDFYVHEEKNYRMVGRDHGRVIRLGDSVTVRVANVNMEARTVELEWLDANGRAAEAGEKIPSNNK